MAVAQVLARLRHGPLGKENGSGINPPPEPNALEVVRAAGFSCNF